MNTTNATNLTTSNVKAALLRVAANFSPNIGGATLDLLAIEWATALPERGIYDLETVLRGVSYCRAWREKSGMPTIAEFVKYCNEARQVFESRERLNAPPQNLLPAAPARPRAEIYSDEQRLRDMAVGRARQAKRAAAITAWREAQMADGIPRGFLDLVPGSVTRDLPPPTESEVATALAAIRQEQSGRTRASLLPDSSRQYRASEAIRREQAESTIDLTTPAQERAAIDKWPHLRRLNAQIGSGTSGDREPFARGVPTRARRGPATYRRSSGTRNTQPLRSNTH